MSEGRHRTPSSKAILKGASILRTKVNYWAVLVAAATTMVTSAAWYIVFANAWLKLRGLDPSTASARPQVWEIAGQLGRNLIVAFVLANLLRRLEVATWKGAVRVAVLLWVGFEAMAIAGSVLHEHYPLGLYAIHVGDALQATLIMSLILGTWRRGARREARREVDPSSAAFTSS